MHRSSGGPSYYIDLIIASDLMLLRLIVAYDLIIVYKFMLLRLIIAYDLMLLRLIVG
jgi:hypothetical protein